MEGEKERVARRKRDPLILHRGSHDCEVQRELRRTGVLLSKDCHLGRTWRVSCVRSENKGRRQGFSLGKDGGLAKIRTVVSSIAS